MNKDINKKMIIYQINKDKSELEKIKTKGMRIIKTKTYDGKIIYVLTY